MAVIDRLSFAIVALMLAGVLAFGGPFEPVKIWEMIIGSLLAAAILAAMCRELAGSALIARPMSHDRVTAVTGAALLAIAGAIYQNTSGSVRSATATATEVAAPVARPSPAPATATVVAAAAPAPEPSKLADSPASAAGSLADAAKPATAVVVSRHGSRHRKARRLHQRRS